MDDIEEWDWYAILEVPMSATEEDISKAYRLLARSHHPDRNKDDPDATTKFQRIKKASEILLNSEERAKYDSKIQARLLRKKRDRESDASVRQMKEDLLAKEAEAAAKKKADSAPSAAQTTRLETAAWIQSQTAKKIAEAEKLYLQRAASPGNATGHGASKATAEDGHQVPVFDDTKAARDERLEKERERKRRESERRAQAASELPTNFHIVTVSLQWDPTQHTYTETDITAIIQTYGTVQSTLINGPGQAILFFYSEAIANSVVQALAPSSASITTSHGFTHCSVSHSTATAATSRQSGAAPRGGAKASGASSSTGSAAHSSIPTTKLSSSANSTSNHAQRLADRLKPTTGTGPSSRSATSTTAKPHFPPSSTAPLASASTAMSTDDMDEDEFERMVLAKMRGAKKPAPE